MSDGTIERLWRRVQFAIGRGRIGATLDDGPVQRVQVNLSAASIRDNTPRVAEYGFASRPLPGCHAVVIFVAGDRANGVVVGTNDQVNRMKNLQPGEVAIHDDQGQSVYLTRAGIVINSAGKPITINGDMFISGALHTGGNLQVDGTITSTGSVTTTGDVNYHGALTHI